MFLRDLSPGYGEIRLFENLNLTLQAGELVCLMGPNGIGKSSLLRTIAGLQAPVAGKIEFAESSLKHFQNVSIVLTDPVIVMNLTVYDLITFGRYPYLQWNLTLSPADRDMIDRTIAMVNIAALTDKKLEELSDGQRQMVMIARAIAQDTPVMLLDEPTSHLDLNNRVEIMRFLRTLARTTGKAILVSTHELDLALQTADLLWLAKDDKTIISGVPEDLILDGSLDDVFRFKGYDLKTGKINQEAHREVAILLKGEGYNYRWTRNALERSGFSVSTEEGREVKLLQGDRLSWSSEGNLYCTLRELLQALQT